MKTVTLRAMVDEERQLRVDVPAEIPIGPVELVIRSLAGTPSEGTALTGDTDRAKLAAHGLLAAGPYAPPDAVSLSAEERDRIGRLFTGSEPLAALIDEDRGPY
jgi:hypothetical protein